MKTTLLAATLLAAAPALLAQAGKGVLSVPGNSARPAAPPLLHLEGHINHLQCGAPLEFEIVVTNRGAGTFPGGADLRVSGATLARPPHEGFVRVTVPPLGTGASQVFHLNTSPNPLKVDCVAAETFLVTLTPGPNAMQPLPQWDREAVELTMTPPTNCSATSSFRHLPHWDPRM